MKFYKRCFEDSIFKDASLSFKLIGMDEGEFLSHINRFKDLAIWEHDERGWVLKDS